MICATLQKMAFSDLLNAVESVEMAELRLDRCELENEDIEDFFNESETPVIATCRVAEIMEKHPEYQSLSPQSKRIKAADFSGKKLLHAINAGAAMVDIELEAPESMVRKLVKSAHEAGAYVIRSYHDFDGTDSFEALKALVEKCRANGADYVKIATTAHSEAEVARVMSLYEWDNFSGTLIAFCMGEAGKQSRIECLKNGAPFTYAAYGEPAAPGQIAYNEMRKLVYGDFHFISGNESLDMPSSKSFAQRAIIAAALADGVSHLNGYTACGDNEAAINVAKALGADVQLENEQLTIKGTAAGLGSLGDKVKLLNVGESGLLARLMMPLIAQLSSCPVTIDGEKTLLDRPLTGAKEILGAFGIKLDSSDDSVKIPLSVSGPASEIRAEIDGRGGSQLISGLMMALPFSEKNTTLNVSGPKSIPYMFITMEVLKKFGIKMSNEMLGGQDFFESDGDWALCTDMVFKIRGNQVFKAADIDLERDWSAAANFLVAGAIFGKTVVNDMDTTSLQADLSVMDILMDACASLSQVEGNSGYVIAQRAPLIPFDVDASNCPDLFPIISVLAAFCNGTSRIKGVERLKNKESDRAGAIVEMLEKMGVPVKTEGDIMEITGKTLAQRCLAGAMLKGGNYSSYHDHRMAMALKVASLGADSPIVIDDEECISKSFPDFCRVFDNFVDQAE